MSKEKMHIWKEVEQSDPASIKSVTIGRKFNTINAHHQVKRATEVFGPFGHGWGVLKEQFLNIIPGMLIYQAELWWKKDEQTGSFDISSSISTHRGNNKLDDECVKKVATDAMTKGLSKLGFNADVFLGLWDDNRYVEKMKEVASVETQESNIEAIQKDMESVLKEASELAKKGDADGIRKLYANNPKMQNLKGFKEKISEAGKKAKEVAKNNTDEKG